MANLTPLRNIHLSGGLFTENLLLKIRDKKDLIPEVQWIAFGEKWQEEKKRYYEVWDWAKRLFGEIVDNFDSWTIEERFEKWIKPLLQKLGHESEPKPPIDLTTLIEEDQDNILNRIQVSHQLKNHPKIGLHICEDDYFDERNDANYQKKSQHDHFQRYILLNESIRWGFLSNGKQIRLLGEYSNIYVKGYIQFNLDSIFINKDESEFWVFYALIHHSRFTDTYGLNPDDWINKLKKRWKDLFKNVNSGDTEINSNIIFEDVLNVYEMKLYELIEKAKFKGVSAVKSSDSESFMQNLKEKGLELGEIDRDIYLKELDSVISDINKNLSVIRRIQKRSQEEGIEAGKKLRKNVKKALELMGEGFINSSKTFSNDILKGKIEIKDFYQELLQITYRLIFVLYAEAKNLLPGVATIYYNDLGLTYLRKKAQQPIRDDQNTDVWYRLLLLFNYLDIGESALGINAFSGELFNSERILLILDESYGLNLPNSTLLKIIYELTIVDLGIGLQQLNYSEIGEEEIGSIYEALLDFQPRYINKDSQKYHFILEEINTERKGSGSYYTPKGLIDILLKTALKPIIDGILYGLQSREDKLEAILDLKICDPACGGGSFLLASIDYMGKIYAQIQSEEEYPEENVLRDSRRKILQHCIYGVDLNPMALELAKISLWLKAAVKNKPLTFLDNHLKEGNSLIGFATKQKIEKIPIKAFKALKGKEETGIADEKTENAKRAQNRLKSFRIGGNGTDNIQQTLLIKKDSEDYTEVAYNVFKMEENNLKDLKEKNYCYAKLKETNTWKILNLLCNTWTSTFFWEMGETHIKEIPTDTLIYKIKKGQINQNCPELKEINRLSEKYKFFNWHLEFPEVFQKKSSGFDCILMNPPWDVLKFEDKEYFSKFKPEVINANSVKILNQNINRLKENDPLVHDNYLRDFYTKKKQDFYFKNVEFYFNSNKTGNIFPIFLERAINLINEKGKIGLIVQSIILSGMRYVTFFQYLIKNNYINSVYSFINEEKIFEGVIHNLQFCLLTLSKSTNILSEKIKAAFFIRNLEKFFKILINYDEKPGNYDNFLNYNEGGTILNLSKDDFKLFNPNTKTIPNFKRFKDYELTKKVFKENPVLVRRNESYDEIENPWKIEIKTGSINKNSIINSNKIKDLKLKEIYPQQIGGPYEILNESNKILPIYQGGSIWFYDHRFNDVEFKKDLTKKRSSKFIRLNDKEHENFSRLHKPKSYIKEESMDDFYPEYWKENWVLVYRDISGVVNNQRSFVPCIIPRYGIKSTLRCIFFKSINKKILCLIGNLSSLVFDYISRNILSGTHFSKYIVEQLPVIRPEKYNGKLIDLISSKVIKLIYTSYDLNDFNNKFFEKKSPYKWNTEERMKLMCQLNAIFFILYGYNRKELEYIIDTFYVLSKIEIKKYGYFQTKNLILDFFTKYIKEIEFDV